MITAWKLCAAVFLIAVLYTTLKNWLPAWAPLIAASCSMFVLVLLFTDSSSLAIFQWFISLQNYAGVDFIACVYRAVGILLLTDLARDFCKDAGLAAAAGCLDFAGRVLVLIAVEPMISMIWEEIQCLTG